MKVRALNVRRGYLPEQEFPVATKCKRPCGDPVEAFTERLQQFIHPDRRGNFLKAFNALLADSRRADIAADPVEAIRRVASPHVKFSAMGDFEAFLRSLRKRSKE